MSVEFDHTLSSHHANSNFSVPSKTSLPFHAAMEQMSKHSSTYLAVGFTVNPLWSPSCALRHSNPRYVTAVTKMVLTVVIS